MSTARKDIFRDYDKIGKVCYRRSDIASRVRIQVKPPGEVVVTLPSKVTLAAAETFLLLKADWVIKQCSKLITKQERMTIFLPDLYFSTRQHRMEMIPEDRSNIRIRVIEGKMIVSYPGLLAAEDPIVQQACRKAVISALSIEARDYLPDRCRDLANHHSLKVAEISVRNNRSRWGSCSSNGNISLNIHLMRLPDELIDYVLLHELAHTIHRDHSPRFHAFLEQLFPFHRGAEKRLRRYSPGIF